MTTAMQFPFNPAMLHIVGRKRSGKTDLMVGIIRTLTARGYRIAAVRHSPHVHKVDAEGTDTEQYKKAGAIGAALITANATNLFIPAGSLDEKLAPVKRAFRHCHLVLVEGGNKEGREKIEVLSPTTEPLCLGDTNLRAVVSRDYTAPGVPTFKHEEIERLCSFIEERYVKTSLSGAIIAGGKSSRLGVNKALLPLQGRLVIERMLETLSPIVSSIKIIANNPSDYRSLNIETVSDLRPGCGPLSGIHAALSLSPTEYVLIVSCDLPLITADKLGPLLFEYPGYDITMFKHKLFEPLCAIYRRTCLPALEELIDHGEYRIIDLFPTLNTRIIRIDQSDAFLSINTKEDYEKLLGKYSRD
jgi:molybdopterin-guanine dinucleotide biosynthesis protein MobB